MKTQKLLLLAGALFVAGSAYGMETKTDDNNANLTLTKNTLTDSKSDLTKTVKPSSSVSQELPRSQSGASLNSLHSDMDQLSDIDQLKEQNLANSDDVARILFAITANLNGQKTILNAVNGTTQKIVQGYSKEWTDKQIENIELKNENAEQAERIEGLNFVNLENQRSIVDLKQQLNAVNEKSSSYDLEKLLVPSELKPVPLTKWQKGRKLAKDAARFGAQNAFDAVVLYGGRELYKKAPEFAAQAVEKFGRGKGHTNKIALGFKAVIAVSALVPVKRIFTRTNNVVTKTPFVGGLVQSVENGAYNATSYVVKGCNNQFVNRARKHLPKKLFKSWSLKVAKTKKSLDS
ncbi:hypothetical protein HOF26_02415 [bacterium]|jgi:hypothetical protein|nr:hypothetical protein [bacterium]